jgi:hypothetical protein
MGIVRGAALYVGALIGPGLLLVPALAVQTAGPASILAWAGLLVLAVYAPVVLAVGASGGGVVAVWVALSAVLMGARFAVLMQRQRGDAWLVTGAAAVGSAP